MSDLHVSRSESRRGSPRIPPPGAIAAPRSPPAAERPAVLQTLVIGVGDQGHRDLLDELRRRSDPSREVRLTYAADLQAASLARVAPPDLIVVLQSWPEEFTASEVAAALARWPLARWVCCYGPWCASDGRTRRIWPAAMRVPTGEALARIDHELEVIRGHTPPLAWTAAADEVIAFDCDTVPRSAACG